MMKLFLQRPPSRSYSILPKRSVTTKHNPSKRWVLYSTVLAASSLGYILFKKLGDEGSGNKNSVELSPYDFTAYRVSQRLRIDDQHFFLELTPCVPQRVNVWKQLTSRKLWSVEIKQPDIMIVRNYTPIPLKLLSGKLQDMDIANDDTNNGKLLFYIKNYEIGEVSRWLRSRPLDSVVELRGPYVDCEVKPSVDDLAILTGGTGIVVALQVLYNNASPYDGKLKLFHISDDLKELGPLKDYLTRVHNENTTSTLLENRKEFMDTCSTNLTKPCLNSYSVVCGPDGFVTSIAGRKYDQKQGPVEGILGAQGWSNDNVYKL